jgi:hypothetical protein
LAPGRGMAGDARGAGVVGDAALDVVLTVTIAASVAALMGAASIMDLPDVRGSVDAALHAVRLAASAAGRAVDFMVAHAADSTVAAPAGSTVAVVGSMAAAVGTLVADTAAGTGNHGPIRSILIRVAGARMMNGWQRMLPAVSFLGRGLESAPANTA